MPSTVTAYLRISTDHQDQASQRQQIADYCRSADLSITSELCDTASGSTPWQSRSIGRLLGPENAGGTVIVSEVSRIARSVVGVLTALQTAAQNHVTVIAARNRLCLDQSLHSKITITILALAAEIERDLIRDRTRAALAARREAGKPIGRQPGTKPARKLDGHGDEIRKLLQAGVTVTTTAKTLGVTRQTVYNWLADNQPQEPR